ncbi:hypothetical protein CTA1_1923 [Colletotrichum tanaceti]|uniref:Uncharacterized protein n=1 Tax=Colletotrichum tanaceti TaxID=1306861 RepID=A0A4U6WYD2_9PEZI|nr:hypothetical protein CTA1_1923 [Colletotrichum tanaceti]
MISATPIYRTPIYRFRSDDSSPRTAETRRDKAGCPPPQTTLLGAKGDFDGSKGRKDRTVQWL